MTAGIKNMSPIILASASPRRRELLNQARIPFIVKPSNFEESLEMEGNPPQKAEALALGKASEVAERTENGLVLGADTIVVLDGTIYGKPANRDEAFAMLSSLSGKEHSVITGIALVDRARGIVKTGHECTKVKFAELSPEEIWYYISTGEPEGKAGAYAVQGLGALLVESIHGCYSNVVGLPLMKLRKMLKELGIDVMCD